MVIHVSSPLVVCEGRVRKVLYEKAGLVERRANPTDRRQRQIVATPRGRDLVEGACQRVVLAQEDLLGTLAPDERVALRRLLNKAATATGEDLDDPGELAPSDPSSPTRSGR